MNVTAFSEFYNPSRKLSNLRLVLRLPQTCNWYHTIIYWSMKHGSIFLFLLASYVNSSGPLALDASLCIYQMGIICMKYAYYEVWLLLESNHVSQSAVTQRIKYRSPETIHHFAFAPSGLSRQAKLLPDSKL